MGICRETEELMWLAQDGLADKAERRSLEVHLKECPQCEASWDAIQDVTLMFTRSPMLAPRAGFVGSVMAGVEARRQRQQLWTRSLIVLGCSATLIAVASIIALACVGAMWGSLPALRTTAITLVGQAQGGAAGFLKGLGMPLRMLGASQSALLFGSLGVLTLVLTGVWAWALVHVDRRSHSASMHASIAF